MNEVPLYRSRVVVVNKELDTSLPFTLTDTLIGKTTLSPKVNLPHAIISRAKCGGTLITLRRPSRPRIHSSVSALAYLDASLPTSFGVCDTGVPR